MSDFKITVSKDGPYLVEGGPPLVRQSIAPNEAGDSVEWVKTGDVETRPKCALCRCGHSKNKPFCDGHHAKVGFDGTETASREPYEAQARRIDGPRYALLDAKPLCATARFCDTYRTAWKEVALSDNPEHAAILLHQTNRCVSGRLVAVDTETGEPAEAPRPERISATEDPAEGCSGPLFVEGGIRVESADGTSWQRRNRMALCRCGQSGNKPFCDGTHIEIGFIDENAPGR